MEKTQKSLLIYIAAFMAILIPIPGRFVYGFTIVLELCFLVLIGTLVSHLVSKLKIESLRTVTVIYILIVLTMLYRQIIAIICPEVALVLSFDFYLPTISLFMIGSVFKTEKRSLKEDITSNFYDVLTISLAGLILSLMRDLFGYGTFTFFGFNHQIYEKLLMSSIKVGIFSFFATIPGALFLCGLFFFFQIELHKKGIIVSNIEKQNTVNAKDKKGGEK